MAGTFVCDRCGKRFPSRRLKEVVYEQDRERIRRELCPSCLDQVMNAASKVRGVVGQQKAAAIHVDGIDGGERQSFGERDTTPPDEG